MFQLLWGVPDSTARGCARVERDLLQSDWGRHRLRWSRILYAQDSAGCPRPFQDSATHGVVYWGGAGCPRLRRCPGPEGGGDPSAQDR